MSIFFLRGNQLPFFYMPVHISWLVEETRLSLSHLVDLLELSHIFLHLRLKADILKLSESLFFLPLFLLSPSFSCFFLRSLSTILYLVTALFFLLLSDCVHIFHSILFFFHNGSKIIRQSWQAESVLVDCK